MAGDTESVLDVRETNRLVLLIFSKLGEVSQRIEDVTDDEREVAVMQLQFILDRTQRVIDLFNEGNTDDRL